jgi:transposase
MYYCGLDLHAKSSAFCIVTAKGRKITEGEVPSTRKGFDEMFVRCDGELVRVVLEASTRTRWAAQVLERLGADVVVVDPRKVRVIAETKHKTDKMDARILADLLRTGALPKPVWQVPQATRELRDQVRLRWGLVRERANLTLRARSMLSSVGINLGKRALASPATWDRVLKRRDVPAHMKKLLEILHDSIRQLGEAIAAVEKEYEPCLADPVVERLEEIPGVGPVVALTTVAA